MMSEELGHRFVRNIVQHSSDIPVPASLLDTASALDTAPASTSVAGSTTPFELCHKCPLEVEHKRLGRFGADGHGISSHGSQGGVSLDMTRHVTLKNELTQYREQDVKADVYFFSLPDVWFRQSDLTLAWSTGDFR